MSSTGNVNDFLMNGGGPPSAKFPTIGTIWKGKILRTELTQQRDYTTGDPKFWDDGNPMMQAVVTIQTDQRDPAVDDDDGHRRLFVKGAMQAAVKEAVLAADARQLEVGGTLAVQYHADGVPKGRLAPPKLFKAKYTPPSLSVDDFTGAGADQGTDVPALEEF